MTCPKCGEEMDHQEEDMSVGIYGGYFCDACSISISDADADTYYEPNND